jgi:hypothetical protein
MEEITSHLFAQELRVTLDQIQGGRVGWQEQELDIELLGKGADRIRPLIASVIEHNRQLQSRICGTTPSPR